MFDRALRNPAPEAEQGNPAPVFAVSQAFDFKSHEYTELFEASEATAFQHPIWMSCFYEHLAPGRDAQPVIVTGRDAAGKLTLLVPLILRTIRGARVLEAADLGVSDYCAPVATMDLKGLSRSISAVLPRHDVLRIGKIRCEHRRAWQALTGFEPVLTDYSAYASRLDIDHAAWRGDAMTDSFRKNVDRKRRKFEKAGKTALIRTSDPSEARRVVDAIAAARAGRFPGDPIQTAPVRAFYRAVATASDDFTRLYTLTLDGADVGHLLGVAHGGRYHYLLIGCDYDVYGKYSPGLILYDWIAADLIEDGFAVFDFTIGDEPFKQEFGCQSTQMFAIEQARTAGGHLALLALALRGRLQAARG